MANHAAPVRAEIGRPRGPSTQPRLGSGVPRANSKAPGDTVAEGGFEPPISGVWAGEITDFSTPQFKVQGTGVTDGTRTRKGQRHRLVH